MATHLRRCSNRIPPSQRIAMPYAIDKQGVLDLFGNSAEYEFDAA